ncbi:MAG: 4'-phosphopantetheinyl transferase superfamily protein [Cyclobacteriaceae bacterium]|nr:4'-phosphopantetheinyl transferase superfamily protein [Cyclobacteriaceae bacterium]
MIGIDIVDIKDSLFHPRTADHLRYIKAKGDQYPENIDPTLLYWIVWSAKEAIFKSKRQLILFNPKLITVVFSNNSHFSSKDLVGTVETTPNYVVATAAPPSMEVMQQIWMNNQKASSQKIIRARIIAYFKPLNIRFTLDENQLPLLCVNEEKEFPISLSHHGNYIAFCIEKLGVLKF